LTITPERKVSTELTRLFCKALRFKVCLLVGTKCIKASLSAKLLRL
jgi:hypothetical protein